jgi:general secretion pathway protein K
MKGRTVSRGAALLIAMLLVTLIASVSAMALCKQSREVDIEAAERARVQSEWLLAGTVDWARLVLREGASAGGVDHLAQRWAQPLGEVALGTFLRAGPGAAASPEREEDGANGSVSARITDMQSRLNVANLAGLGRVSAPSLRAFARLFEVLGLPPAELAALADHMRRASDLGAEGAERALSPVAPQRLADLGAFGLSPATLRRLAPYVTLLPARTPVNLNTASAEVIYSVFDGLGLADAQRVTGERATTPFRAPADAARALGLPVAAVADQGAYSVGSRFFEIRAQATLDRFASTVTALVQRDGADVVVLQRDRGPGLLP